MRSKIRIFVGAALVVLILSGCRPPPTPVQKPAPAPKPTVNAVGSWKAFVQDARDDCAKEKESPGSVDYQKLYAHGGQSFGVMIVGWPESEYFIDLYRFDAKSDKWIDSPRSSPDGGYDSVDVPAASKQWKVPEATIRQWLDEADRTVKDVYSKRQ